MTEPKKLPPLRNLYVPTIGEVVCAHYGDELDTKQSAEVLRRCEMHDRLLEALKLNLAEQLRIQGRMDLDDSPGVIMARAILKENQ